MSVRLRPLSGMAASDFAPYLDARARTLVERPMMDAFTDGGEIERVPLADLRPTQMAVGMRAVAAKRRKIERRARSARKLRHYIEKRPIPAVLGPCDDLYIIDRHHLGLALWQSEVEDVYVRVVCDFSDLPQRSFLGCMTAMGWMHSYDSRGERICPTRLPGRLDQLRSDRYRDLAWSVREAGGFSKSLVPFSEFAWADFFRARIARTVVHRNFERAHDLAMAMARTRDARHLPGYLNRG